MSVKPLAAIDDGLLKLIFLKIRNVPILIMATLMVSNCHVSSSFETSVTELSNEIKPPAVMAYPAIISNNPIGRYPVFFTGMNFLM